MLQDSPFPNYDQVKPEYIVPGIRGLLALLGKEIDDLERNVTPTWEGLIDPLERITDKLSRAWGTISHLKGVKDSPALREAYEEVSFNFLSVIECAPQLLPFANCSLMDWRLHDIAFAPRISSCCSIQVSCQRVLKPQGSGSAG